MAKRKATPKTTQELNAAIVEAQKRLLSAIKEVKEVSEEEAEAVPVEEIVPENSAASAELTPVDSTSETECAQPHSLTAGNADPLTALVPATATSVTVTQVTKLADLSSAELDAYIKDRAVRCERHVAGFARRVSELYLALFEMEGRFNKQQGARTDLKELPAKTWTEYVQGSGANYDNYRKWKSRMNAATKQLGVVVAPDKGDSKGSKGGSSNNAAVTQAAKELADAKVKLGKSAEDGSEQAKAIIADYEKKHEAALVQAQAEDSNAKPSSEFKVNKRLAAIVEVGEHYIRVMERVVNSNAVTVTDRQKKDIETASQAWRKVLRDARELTWAIKTIERQEKEAA
jgi:hypothetical protein